MSMDTLTDIEVSIAGCPPGQAGPLLIVLEEFGIAASDLIADRPDPGPGRLRLGRDAYRGENTPLGTARELARILPVVAPDASWRAVEYGNEGWCGTVASSTPDLGIFAAPCDDEGRPLIGARTAMSLIESVKLNAITIEDARTRTGLAVQDAVDDLLDRDEGIEITVETPVEAS